MQGALSSHSPATILRFRQPCTSFWRFKACLHVPSLGINALNFADRYVYGDLDQTTKDRTKHAKPEFAN